MSWQLFTLISVVSLSLSVILQRILLHKDKVDPFAYAVIFQCIVGLLLLSFAFMYGFKLPHIESVIIPAIVSIVCFGVGHILYAKTLQKVEASAFSVLFATQAIWLMILGIILLDESMTLMQLCGAILIFLSVGLLAKNHHSIFTERGAILGLFTGLLFGIAIYSWSYVGRFTDIVSWAAVSFLGAALISLLVQPSSIRKMKTLLHPRILPKLTMLAIFYGTGSLTMLLAYKYGAFAIVSPLRQTSIIITVLLALLLLPLERDRLRRKIFAALICTIGVILIVI